MPTTNKYYKALAKKHACQAEERSHLRPQDAGKSIDHKAHDQRPLQEYAHLRPLLRAIRLPQAHVMSVGLLSGKPSAEPANKHHNMRTWPQSVSTAEAKPVQISRHQ